MKRHGVTMVEVMVASVIAVVLFLAVWGIFTGSMKQFHATQTNLEAMQVGQMVLEVVETDVQGLVLQGPQDPGILSSMAPRSTLEFFVARNAGAGSGTWPPVYRGERVSYELEPVAGKPWSVFVRNGIPYGNLFVKALEFRPVEQESFAGTKHYYLQTTVTAVDGTGDREFTMVGLVALDLLTRTRLGRLWQPNEYPKRSNPGDPLPPSYRQF